ncbi:hypothetical protein F5Y15DRAFT_373384 [Xylariaceae sp. FL0016]|nr:hypothetical protein F5Y15DRAFT_373384 [Xylariaceae sp. FL0016]
MIVQLFVSSRTCMRLTQLTHRCPIRSLTHFKPLIPVHCVAIGNDLLHTYFESIPHPPPLLLYRIARNISRPGNLSGTRNMHDQAQEAMTSLPALPPNYAAALRLIDDAHAEDPRTVSGGEGAVPYELHYARKMTRWLGIRCPEAGLALQLACRAQHFRRWEIPRDTYPKTRAGYLTWRAKQKAEAASQVQALLSPSSPSASSPSPISPPLPASDIARTAALIRKENLAADPETQVLEDVACLVFLDDQFDDFEARMRQSEQLDEEKMLGILRKTWGKMSEEGRRLALGMQLSDRGRELVGKALAG